MMQPLCPYHSPTLTQNNPLSISKLRSAQPRNGNTALGSAPRTRRFALMFQRRAQSPISSKQHNANQMLEVNVRKTLQEPSVVRNPIKNVYSLAHYSLRMSTTPNYHAVQQHQTHRGHSPHVESVAAAWPTRKCMSSTPSNACKYLQ